VFADFRSCALERCGGLRAVAQLPVELDEQGI
jgi:hypothetical protein